MPFTNADLIESLLGCLPELVDGIEPHILASFLKDAGMDASLPKAQIMEKAHEDRLFLEMLGIMWVDSHPALWARVGLSSVQRIRETIDDLAKEYGTTNLRIAVLQDDRQTVRDLGVRLAPKPTHRRPKKPILVDGSNVAWNGEVKPRLQNLLSLRDQLLSEGYSPVYVYVDAALIHQIDEMEKLRGLISESCFIAADSGSAADEAIVRHAIRLSCPVITNDRMTEWDPLGEVTKYRFAINGDNITVYNV